MTNRQMAWLNRIALSILMGLIAVSHVHAMGTRVENCPPAPSFPRVDFGDYTTARLVGHAEAVELSLRIADEPEEHRRGLMYVPHLAPHEGMLFLFAVSDFKSFWMKNTCVGLDLLFLDERGEVLEILTNAEPFSLEPLPSRQPARAILEVPAGSAERWGVRVGDRLQHEAFPLP